jgi:uncharacterized membrane protein YraQ (UPF0718 family)
VLALAVLLSVGGLCVGPLLVALGQGRSGARMAVDGATLALVPALVALRIAPHLVEEVGLAALGLLAAGFVGFALLERRTHHAPGKSERIEAAIVMPAMIAHSLSDGAGLSLALASGHDHEGHSGPLLAVALILHRLPEGLVLATRLVPTLGWRRTLGRIGALAACTVVGALSGATLLRSVPEEYLEAIVAVGVGMILRMSLHGDHHAAPPSPRDRRIAGLGFVGALALVVLVPDKDALLHHAQDGEPTLVRTFTSLFVELAPAALVGLFVTTLSRAVAGPRLGLVATGPSRSLVGRAARGVALALASPPEALDASARRLVARRAPTATFVAYVFAARSLDAGALVLSAAMLGGVFTLAWGGVGLVGALVAGVLAGLFAGAIDGADAPPPTSLSLRGALATRLRNTASDAVAAMAAWYVVGLSVAAAIEALVPAAWVMRLQEAAGRPGELVLALVVGSVASLGSYAVAPIAAIGAHKGVTLAAVFAFVAAGATASVGALAVLRTARARLVVGACSVALGAGVGVALGAPTDVPELHGLVDHLHGGWEWASAALLALALLASLVELGPREWFGRMRPGASPHDPHSRH